MLWRLPEHLVTDVLVLSHELDAYDELDVRPTRSLGRLASLARFLAVPARIASLRVVEASEALSEQLRDDETISRHFRTVILRAPSGRPGQAERRSETERIERWKQDAAGLLASPGPARHLVLDDGGVAAFDVTLAWTMAARTWYVVTLTLDPRFVGRSGSIVYKAMMDAIATCARSLAVCLLSPDRQPRVRQLSTCQLREWPRLQRLVARDTRSWVIAEIVGGAPSVHTLDVYEMVDIGSTPRHLVLSVPRAHYHDLDFGARSTTLANKCAAVRTRKAVETVEFVVRDQMVYGLIDALPPGLAVLRVSMKCGADWDATIRILLAALQPDRWTDARRPRALELVWTPKRRRADSVDNPTLAIQASLVPLREQCAARGVDLEVFVEMGGSCRCGAASLSSAC